MSFKTKSLAVAALGAAVALGGLTASTSAGAYVVCNRENACWRVHDKYDYPPAAGVVVYGDDWKFPNHHYRWHHEHNGRGYWENGHWHTF
jgi:hypothetical protein